MHAGGFHELEVVFISTSVYSKYLFGTTVSQVSCLLHLFSSFSSAQSLVPAMTCPLSPHRAAAARLLQCHRGGLEQTGRGAPLPRGRGRRASGESRTPAAVGDEYNRDGCLVFPLQVFISLSCLLPTHTHNRSWL